MLSSSDELYRHTSVLSSTLPPFHRIMAGGAITVSKPSSRPQPSSKPETTWFVYWLGLNAVIGGFLFGYDTGVVSSATPYFSEEFEIGYMIEELTVSITMLFCGFFALLAGATNDYFGRRKTIMMGAALFTAGSALLAASQSPTMLLFGRAVIGSGIGFASMTVPTYIAECAPVHVRGSFVVGFQLMITFGIFCASVLGYIFSLPSFNPEYTGWRLMFATATVPSIFQFISFIFLPESPRWLVENGRVAEARKVLARMYTVDEWREYELEEIVASHEEAKRDIEARVSSGDVGDRFYSRWPITLMLTTPHVRKALLVGMAIQMFQQFGGINTLIYYTTTVIHMSGVRDKNKAILLSTGVNAVNFVFTFLPIFLVEKLGRRKLLLGSILGVISALILLGLSFLLVANTSANIGNEIVMNETWHSLPVDKQSNNAFNQAQFCRGHSTCDACVTSQYCGMCYARKYENATIYPKFPSSNFSIGYCLPVEYGKTDHSWIGECDNSSLVANKAPFGEYVFAYDYCLSDLSFLVLISMMLYLVAFSVGMGPMAWVICAEVFPNWARSTGVALTTATNWFANFAISQTFLTIVVSLTKYGAFWLYAGLTTISFVIFYKVVPETKGLPMEHIEDLFRSKEEMNKINAMRRGEKMGVHDGGVEGEKDKF